MGMMGNSQFYHKSLRKIIVMFGNMFNDMVVQRTDASGATIQTMAVPISYSPKEKFLARLAADPNLDRSLAITLPQLSFEMISMQYDASRRLQGGLKNVVVDPNDLGKVKRQYVPVPYNMNFVLYAYVRNADDGAQIMEQIVPFFAPEWTSTIRLVPEISLNLDVPTILQDVTTEDTYEGDFTTRRAMIYTFNFVVKGYFFGPVKRQGIIKRVQIDAAALPGDTDITDAEMASKGRDSRIVVVPGQWANGAPTANSAESIAYSLISANSNFGLAVNTFFYTDNRKYSPITGEDSELT